LYRRNARKDYLNLAKCKKRTTKKIRKAIKKQLAYVSRDLSYISDCSLKTPRYHTMKEPYIA
ncbi:MAG: IS5/IS1182 family transposase, partial [Lachnospiraceae bacterium]|nr:IS5/IS1182 family transposase [Lachnospiraceae bacterium]